MLEHNRDLLSEHRGAFGWSIRVCKLDPNFRVQRGYHLLPTRLKYYFPMHLLVQII